MVRPNHTDGILICKENLEWYQLPVNLASNVMMRMLGLAKVQELRGEEQYQMLLPVWNSVPYVVPKQGYIQLMVLDWTTPCRSIISISSAIEAMERVSGLQDSTNKSPPLAPYAANIKSLSQI